MRYLYGMRQYQYAYGESKYLLNTQSYSAGTNFGSTKFIEFCELEINCERITT